MNEKIKTQGAYEFMEKYGVDVPGPFTSATAAKAACRMAYDKGWMDCMAKIGVPDTNVGNMVYGKDAMDALYYLHSLARTVPGKEGIFESFKQVYNYIAMLERQVDGKWIPCSERLPEEHDSVFAKYKGTNKWNDSMFEKVSDDVNVTIEFEDGIRRTKTMHTTDGKWKKEVFARYKVIAWMPLPEPYKGDDTE